MARLVPVPLPSSSNEPAYGYSNDPYAAQPMMSPVYRAGMDVGGLGSFGAPMGSVTDLNGLSDESFDPFAAERVGGIFDEPTVASPSSRTNTATQNGIPATDRPRLWDTAGQEDFRARAPTAARANTGEAVSAIIGGVVALATAGITLGFAGAQANKDREQELAVMTARSDLAVSEAELAALESGEDASSWPWIIGGVAIVGVIGGVLMYKRKKKTGES